MQDFKTNGPQGQMDFNWCIAPLTPDAFFAHSFEKKALRIQRDQADYYRDLLSIDDIDRAVTTMGLSTPELRVTQADKDIVPDDFSYDSGFVDAVRANQLFAQGATIILSNLQERLPVLADFCRALEQAFSCRIQTNIYLTPAKSQGFRAHYDSHDVLVLQVEGTKEWRLYDQPVELPLNSQAFNADAVPIGPLSETFLLEPGDMLYIPRGLTHDAVATDQTSLHITTGLMTRSWADVMVEAVMQVAENDPALRASLPPGHGSAGYTLAEGEKTFQDLLGRIAENAQFEPLLTMARSTFIGNRVPRAHGQLRQLANLQELNEQTPVSARPSLIYDFGIATGEASDGQAEGATMLRLSCQGAHIMLPMQTRQTVEHCLRAVSCQIESLEGDLDAQSKLVLVKRLISEGLMVAD